MGSTFNEAGMKYLGFLKHTLYLQIRPNIYSAELSYYSAVLWAKSEWDGATNELGNPFAKGGVGKIE